MKYIIIPVIIETTTIMAIGTTMAIISLFLFISKIDSSYLSELLFPSLLVYSSSPSPFSAVSHIFPLRVMPTGHYSTHYEASGIKYPASHSVAHLFFPIYATYPSKEHYLH